MVESTRTDGWVSVGVDANTDTRTRTTPCLQKRKIKIVGPEKKNTSCSHPRSCPTSTNLDVPCATLYDNKTYNGNIAAYTVLDPKSALLGLLLCHHVVSRAVRYSSTGLARSAAALDLPLEVLDPVLGAVHLGRVAGVHSLGSYAGQAPQLHHLNVQGYTRGRHVLGV